MISLVLADDHAIVRAGFKMILDAQPDFQVVGEASGVEDALAAVRDLTPDVLVTDISMQGEKNGLILVERMVQAGLATRAVVLTMHEEQEFLVQALKAGAMGYVLKGSSDTELFKAIRRASQGEVCICDDMMGVFVNSAIDQGTSSAVPSLTPRETQVVTLAVKGYSNADIAQELSISPKTVENQKTKIMAKLGLSSRRELFQYAIEHNLLNI